MSSQEGTEERHVTKKVGTEVKNEAEHLKCLYTNIDGLNATKGAELQVIIAEKEPHLIFLTETKLSDDTVASQFIDCSNYTVIRKDRVQEEAAES